MTLNQRAQGSSPCAPANDFNGLSEGIFRYDKAIQLFRRGVSGRGSFAATSVGLATVNLVRTFATAIDPKPIRPLRTAVLAAFADARVTKVDAKARVPLCAIAHPPKQTPAAGRHHRSRSGANGRD